MHHTIRHQQFETELQSIPDELHDGFRAYVLHGARPSGLVGAVVSGSLFDTYTRADGAMRDWIPTILRFCIVALPMGAYGSPEHVAMWGAKGGLLGRSARKAA